MNVVSTFPLLHLPKKALMNSLRNMDYLQIIGFSILTKKTKNLVESLKVTAMAIPVFVTNSFGIRLEFPNHFPLYFLFYHVQENEPIQELETPENIYIGNGNVVLWENVMSVKQLLDHLQYIFHTSIGTLYFGPNCEQFSLESIQKNVSDCKSICFPSEDHEQNRRVLRFFQPTRLALLDESLIDGHVPRSYSIQNFDLISANKLEITLDDLLVTNALSIKLFSDTLSIKIVNRFLKLWKKGSNPRLELLFLRFRFPDFQNEDLLRGLKCQCIPLNIRRNFKTSGEEKPQEVIGGWDLWRFDGRQATITFRRSDSDVVYINLFVWHDHCALI